MSKNVTRIAAAGITAGLLFLSGPAAGAKSPAIVRSGHCTKTSVWKLKLKFDDAGKLESEFEVDQNRNNVRWNVAMSDNGTQVYSGTAVTKAPSGSFTVNRRLTNRVGTDSIVARATNPATGEVCRGTAAL